MFKSTKAEFMEGIRPGDVLIIERYAHIFEYGELIDTVCDPETNIVTHVKVHLFETGEEDTFSVLLVEPLTINTLTLQKFGFDNIERETIYANSGAFSLQLKNDDEKYTGERIYVSTHSSPKCWIYKENDNFDRDDEHAVLVKFIYDIQHEFEKYCGKKLDLSKTYVSNSSYDQKKKDYDEFVKKQIREILNNNLIYSGNDFAARILKELSDEYAD